MCVYLCIIYVYIHTYMYMYIYIHTYIYIYIERERERGALSLFHDLGTPSVDIYDDIPYSLTEEEQTWINEFLRSETGEHFQERSLIAMHESIPQETYCDELAQFIRINFQQSSSKVDDDKLSLFSDDCEEILSNSSHF